jgi:hypothetical protein
METPQNTDRIDRTSKNIGICRSFMRAILFVSVANIRPFSRHKEPALSISSNCRFRWLLRVFKALWVSLTVLRLGNSVAASKGIHGAAESKVFSEPGLAV